MLMVISPAKTLDFTSSTPSHRSTQPRFLEHSAVLMERLREKSPSELSALMKISDKIAHLNAERNAVWSVPFDKHNARAALFAFMGDVYTGLDAYQLDADSLARAQKRLRILSGLYGLLRPMDLIQPYRLEMGTKLANPAGADLYSYWRDTLTDAINADLRAGKHDTLVNLASNEYFQALDRKRLDVDVITPTFLDEKSGKFKIISFYAKKARGLMAAWVLRNNIESARELSDFDVAGYRFSARDSDANTLVFRRKQKDVPSAG